MGAPLSKPLPQDVVHEALIQAVVPVPLDQDDMVTSTRSDQHEHKTSSNEQTTSMMLELFQQHKLLETCSARFVVCMLLTTQHPEWGAVALLLLFLMKNINGATTVDGQEPPATLRDRTLEYVGSTSRFFVNFSQIPLPLANTDSEWGKEAVCSMLYVIFPGALGREHLLLMVNVLPIMRKDSFSNLCDCVVKGNRDEFNNNMLNVSIKHMTGLQ